MSPPPQQKQQEQYTSTARPNKRKRRPEDRCLWKPAVGTTAADPCRSLPDQHHNHDDEDESYESVLQQFSSRPRHKSWTELCSNALVVVQEVALTCFFLARHDLVARIEDTSNNNNSNNNNNNHHHQSKQQEQQLRLDQSTFFLSLALLIVLFFSHQSQQQPQLSRQAKIRQRTVDGLLLALLLRFLASLLRSLTASYSSDTVQALARAGMLWHVVACDYTYANGGGGGGGARKQPRIKMDPTSAGEPAAQSPSLPPHPSSSSYRPPFQGGTVSLTAALFSTTLLVSRLSSNLSAYFFLSLAVVTFAFYPVTRSALAASYPARSSRTFIGCACCF